jgi:hypothetical protein
MTDDPKMIERVKAAIKAAHATDWEAADHHLSEHDILIYARAAMAAMRKPSAKMCIAGLLVYKPDAPEDEFATGVMFDAMIDAALADADC